MSKHQTPINKPKGVFARTAPRRPSVLSHDGQPGVGVQTSSPLDRGHTKVGRAVAAQGVFNGKPPGPDLPGTVFAPLDTGLSDAELAAVSNANK